MPLLRKMGQIILYILLIKWIWKRKKHKALPPSSITGYQPDDLTKPDSETEPQPEQHEERSVTFIEKPVTVEPVIKIDTTKNKPAMKEEMPCKPGQLPVEFQYLFDLVRYRLSKHINIGVVTKPDFPDIDTWMPNLKKVINDNFPAEKEEENHRREAAQLFLIALAPYSYPHIFDDAICGKLDNNTFPRIGGMHGKNFRGFLPTGETAIFLIGADDYSKRLIVQELFNAESVFSIKKILWLEELSHGEPSIQGRVIMSQDYVDTCMYGTFKPPHFSTSFPARKIDPDLVWEDLVINKELNEQISEIEAWVNFNERMIKQWKMGDRYRRGYRALFYGPPGTGKTLTAGLLGKRTKKDVYKIDLSMVVSKYIGETEKNLELLFARAEDKNWILFFDEADALFGKRTNVRDAHDKYANQEVSYLLQRIEDYNGLVILATNMRSNIDDAFLRRFNSILKFPVPSSDERVVLWKKIFPQNVVFWRKTLAPETGIGPETVDVYELIRKYELSGGSILNVVHYASLRGIEKYDDQKKKLDVLNTYTSCPIPYPESVIYLDDILYGIRKEMIKEGKPFESI